MEGNSWSKVVNGKLKRCTCGIGQYTCAITMENTFLLVADGAQIHKISLFEGDVFRRDYIANLPGMTKNLMTIEKVDTSYAFRRYGGCASR